MVTRRDFSKSILTTGAALLASDGALPAAKPNVPVPDSKSAEPATTKPRISSLHGLVHTPPTPFTPDDRVDGATLQKLVDFMVRQGADVFAQPMHIAEVLTMSSDERHLVAKLTVEAVNGRVPVIIHTSATGTDEVVALSRQAQSVGAQAVISTTPYYWHPPAAGVLDHFVKLGSSIDIAFLAYHNEGAGPLPVSILPEIMRRCPNFIGLKEASHTADYLAEACRLTNAIRPEFGVFIGSDYPLFTMPMGGAGNFSPIGFIAPRLVRSLMDACSSGDYKKAVPLQYKASHLYAIIKDFYMYSSAMAAMEIVGRPCGNPRLPIPTLDRTAMKSLEARLNESGILEGEPYGWT
ncbi:MAG: dihydrodipicolinate synthase family protein [Terriglobia bacterium]